MARSEKDREEATLIYEDRHVVVAVKPPGLDVHGRSPDDPSSFLALVARTLRLAPRRLHPASRLDKPVSGLVVFARSKLGRKALTEQYQRRLVSRTYVALAAGTPSPGEGRFEASIGPDPRDRRRQAVSVPEAKPAETGYRVISSLGAGTSLVELAPRTGRTHQLRVHLSAAGCPIVGDRRYGGPTRLTTEGGAVIEARRVMLHAASLRWRDAETGRARTVESALWSDMEGLVERLTGESRG